jgi:hypothetical protein
MHLSRELAIKEMKATVEILHQWIDELENPRVIVDGKELPLYPQGIPSMLLVVEIENISVPQFRSELAVAAAKLEAIAST